MRRKARNKKGQSLVEYGIGIGAVSAVCMLVLGGLGHASADMINAVLSNINDPNDQQADPGSAFANVGSSKGLPWQPL